MSGVRASNGERQASRADQPSPCLHAAAGLIAAIWAKCSTHAMGGSRMGYPLLRAGGVGVFC